MSKVISVRVSDDVAELFDGQAKKAGVGRADYLTGLIVQAETGEAPQREPDESVDPSLAEQKRQREVKRTARRERKAALAESVVAGLAARQPDLSGTAEIKDRMQADAPSMANALAEKVAVIAQKVERARPHTLHSGRAPIPGCEGCDKEVEWLKKQKTK